MVVPVLPCLLWVFVTMTRLWLRERNDKGTQDEQTNSAAMVATTLLLYLSWMVARRVLLWLRAHAKKGDVQEHPKHKAEGREPFTSG